ncbi:MAG: S24 family peptidase [Isosphaeraceae bacterium]
MARKKAPKVRINVKAALSRRLREIRQELFGDHGGPELARRLGLTPRIWYNYETGVTVPAEILLAFIEQTGANPSYLISGEGPKYRRPSDEPLPADLTPVELIRRGLERLERSAGEVVIVPPETMSSDYVAVNVYPLERIGGATLAPSDIEGQIMAHRQLLTDPAGTIAVRVTDSAMHPILPMGSIVAVDRSLTDPVRLSGQIVAASPEGTPMIRLLEVSGRHLILRPSSPSRDFPMVPVQIEANRPSRIIGRVAWSWSRFAQD